jgi:hypothetical protein
MELFREQGPGGIVLAVAAAGEMISVAHAFQPSGRFSAANSL